MTEVLDKDRHARLLMDADALCEVANVPRAMLDKSATEFCAQKEINWIKNYHQRVVGGRSLLLTGGHNMGPEVKMMAIAAALMRNFIDARVVPLNTLLQAVDTGKAPDPTVLLIPNLFVRGGGKTVPAWKMQQAYDLLLQRMVAGKLSVVYVEDMEALKTNFGSVFKQHLDSHYDLSTGA